MLFVERRAGPSVVLIQYEISKLKYQHSEALAEGRDAPPTSCAVNTVRLSNAVLCNVLLHRIVELRLLVLVLIANRRLQGVLCIAVSLCLAARFQPSTTHSDTQISAFPSNPLTPGSTNSICSLVFLCSLPRTKVRLRQQVPDGLEDRLNLQLRAPAVNDRLHADLTSVRLYVGVVHCSLKRALFASERSCTLLQ